MTQYWEILILLFYQHSCFSSTLTMWANTLLRGSSFLVHPAFKLSCNRLTANFSKARSLSRFILPTVSTLSYLYFLKNNRVTCAQSSNAVNKHLQKYDKRLSQMQPETLVSSKSSFFEKVWSVITHTLRFFQLMIIFMPVIVLFPLSLFKQTKNLWLSLFVKSVEWAGVVWIKAFQYMSHRRDMIGPEMAQKFVHLRENAPQHSFEETQRNFKKRYGKEIHDIFQEFDQKPLASGSVSQVYRAKYKGKKVAVKVRHPGVDRYIQRDINLLFFFSRVLSLFSKSFNLPVSQTSMKKTLIDQIDFKNEHDNLLIFNEMFKGNQMIKFPAPFSEDTSESVLVESFVEGVPITYFETNPHPLNSVIARLGATTFFEMLMKNNFIHADCHGGNILVQIQEKSVSFFSEVWDYVKEQYYKFEQYCVSAALQSQVLKKLYLQSKIEQKNVRRILKECHEKVVVTLIDVGMVIRLDENDRMNFINFLKSVLHGDGDRCAQMIYGLSIFDGSKIVAGKFEEYMKELKDLFGVLNGNLDDLEGVELLTGMLNIIRDHNMKLQGQFATLLTNMLVLQAMAKDIDPDINILKCAVPYFKYAQKNDKHLEYNPEPKQLL